MAYSKQRKQEAVVAMARAFLNRGAMIQYDQSRLDPNHITTSRRDLFASPEEGTKQHITHIDCSGFVYEVYYQTFGYQLKKTLTHDMFELDDIKVFHYDVTGKETEADRRSILRKFKDTLEVGDIIVFEFGANGHAMLYSGNEKIIHSFPLGGDSDSYRHATKHETYCSTGAIYETDLSILTEAAPDGKYSLFYLFQRNCFRFCILRPLDVVDEITENALRRSDPANHLSDLVIQVLTSHPEGRSADLGDTVSYQVELTNIGQEDLTADVTFAAPSGTVQKSGSNAAWVVPAGATLPVCWCVQVEKAEGRKLPQPLITVNSMTVAAPEVILGKNMSFAEVQQLRDSAATMQKAVEDGSAAIRKIYPRALPESFTSAGEAIRNLFAIVDQPRGLALARKPGTWAENILVPTFFGGMSVISLEKICDENRKDRVRRPRASALQPGDIMICCDDIHGQQAYACVCLSQNVLYGKFELNGSIGILEGSAVDSWMEALLGRNCFVLLRPSLGGL